MTVKPVTFAVHEDEKAWSLREVNLVRPPKHQNRRYQVITVIRDDRLTEWWKDLGPAKKFTVPQLEIPALMEHSVAELRAIAEEYRLGDDYWTARSAEIAAESTLIPDIINQREERQKIIHNRSTFGADVRKQRNGFPLRAVKERTSA